MQMCIDWQREFVLLVERLGLLHLQSFNKKIEIPNKWGSHTPLISGSFLITMKSHIMTLPTWKEIEDDLKPEIDIKWSMINWKEPIIPGTLFMLPTNVITTRANLLPLFPEFPKISEQILATQLPFSMSLWRHDLARYLN